MISLRWLSLFSISLNSLSFLFFFPLSFAWTLGDDEPRLFFLPFLRLSCLSTCGSCRFSCRVIESRCLPLLRACSVDSLSLFLPLGLGDTIEVFLFFASAFFFAPTRGLFAPVFLSFDTESWDFLPFFPSCPFLDFGDPTSKLAFEFFPFPSWAFFDL